MVRASGKDKSFRYAPEFKVKVIRTALERKLTGEEVENLYNISRATYYTWRKQHDKGGDEALQSSGRRPGRKPQDENTPLLANIRRQVLDVKRKFPFFGIGRIGEWLRRTESLPATRGRVRKVLKQAGLVELQVRKRRKYEWKPQSFERARPNQLWQSDITAFTIANNLRAYLIGFMDDRSRYMVGWGLYAGQSGGLVLEVFRNAISKYGRPEEVLTDNGRQYKSWQGITDFQKELQREGIKHITSRPHHPQTLGKIESFWGHLKREFLKRVVMGGLEDMRERMAHWVNYYNFQRPHIYSRPNQKPEYATPAERFFEFSRFAREEIQKQVAANEKELAFADPKPREVLGEGLLGETKVQVRKDGTDYVVLLDGREVKRTDLNPRKETNDETPQDAAGAAGSDGPGGEGEGDAGALGAVGGEVDQRGVPGGGPAAVAVLQAGGQDGAVDGGDGNAAGGNGEAGRSGGDPDAGGGDGGAAPGAATDAEPGADHAEGAGPQEPKTPENRPGEAEGGPFDAGACAGAGPDSDGPHPGAGEAAGAAGAAAAQPCAAESDVKEV